MAYNTKSIFFKLLISFKAIHDSLVVNALQESLSETLI